VARQGMLAHVQKFSMLIKWSIKVLEPRAVLFASFQVGDREGIYIGSLIFRKLF
jgi:hypothetical protein